MAVKTTKHVGQVKRYSSVAGRTKNHRQYKFAEIGDDYLTNFEVEISMDQIPHAHKTEKPLTLSLMDMKGSKWSLGMGHEGKFFFMDKDLNKMADAMTTPAIFIFIIFLISLGAIGYGLLAQGQGTPFDGVGPLIFGFFISVISGLTLLSRVGMDALIQAPALRKTQKEKDKVTAEAEKDGFALVKIDG